jgi:thiamine pyrophosphate-dependent acetolactate synthase large subunit-like protein
MKALPNAMVPREEGLKSKPNETQTPVSPSYLSYEIGRLASKYGLAILDEYPFNPRYADLNEYGSCFGDPSMDYLGWVLGAAVGYRIATGKDVIAISAMDLSYSGCQMPYSL